MENVLETAISYDSPHDGIELVRIRVPRHLAKDHFYICTLIDEIKEALLDLHLVACQEPNG